MPNVAAEPAARNRATCSPAELIEDMTAAASDLAEKCRSAPPEQRNRLEQIELSMRRRAAALRAGATFEDLAAGGDRVVALLLPLLKQQIAF